MGGIVRTFVVAADVGRFQEAAAELAVTQQAVSKRIAALDLATFMGRDTRLVWPADPGLRRIPVVDPTPVYPHSLLWHRASPHPALATLRAHLAATAAGHGAAGTWTPGWANPR